MHSCYARVTLFFCFFFMEASPMLAQGACQSRHYSHINIIYTVDTERVLFICILCKHIRWLARYVACSQC
uniref:Putative secreted protein ovary overexpressed n=1 Tax=Rhipicephalus microplus TaxID=6941 RepID=A0A6M2DEK7_RHIMP